MKYTGVKPILLTGATRSGSTWVGRMIAKSPSIGYIHEPCNLLHPPGICAASFTHWFPYISEHNESLYYDDFNRCFSFEYRLLKQLKALKTFEDVAKTLRDYTLFSLCRLLRKRPLVKDPIAVFSAEWFAERFGMNVVVLIKHPAAFVGSIKKKNWTHNFGHFLQQPLLMEHLLSEFKYEIEHFAKTNRDIIEQAILLWNLVHYAIQQYRIKYPHWIFVRHEDLASDPLIAFSHLFHKMNIKYSYTIQQAIMKYSSANNPKLSTKLRNRSIRRDSKSNILTWKRRLTAKEIDKVRKGTEQVACNFYYDEDWY